MNNEMNTQEEQVVETEEVVTAEEQEALKDVSPDEETPQKTVAMPGQPQTEQLTVTLTEKQKAILFPAIEERAVAQRQVQMLQKREGEISALIADAHGIEHQILGGGISEDGKSLILTVVSGSDKKKE